MSYPGQEEDKRCTPYITFAIRFVSNCRSLQKFVIAISLCGAWSWMSCSVSAIVHMHSGKAASETNHQGLRGASSFLLCQSLLTCHEEIPQIVSAVTENCSIRMRFDPYRQNASDIRAKQFNAKKTQPQPHLLRKSYRDTWNLRR